MVLQEEPVLHCNHDKPFKQPALSLSYKIFLEKVVPGCVNSLILSALLEDSCTKSLYFP